MSSLWMTELINSMDGRWLEVSLYSLIGLASSATVSWLASLKDVIIQFMVQMGNFNAIAFTRYLKAVKDQHDREHGDDEDFIVCCDNASIHKSKDIKYFAEKNKINILWITPYSPWLNPVETYISNIKASLAASRRKGK